MLVLLQPVDGGPRLRAPEFCGYSKDGEVNASICSLCKRCTFVSQLPGDALVKVVDYNLSTDEQFRGVAYLTEVNHKLAKSIKAQIQYLKTQQRMVLAFLINAAAAEQLLSYCFSGDITRSKGVLNTIINRGVPAFELQGCPVYISRKLTLSSVQVVGEVTWV